MREAVRTRCGISLNDSRYAEVPDRINEALHGLELEAPGGWDWLRASGTTSTVAEQSYLTFQNLADAITAAGVRAVIDPIKIAYGDGFDNLRREQKQDLDDAFGPIGSTSDAVQYYAVEGQRVWFYPTPTSALAVRFSVVIVEPDLTGDADVPLMPTVYHRTLVSAASALMLRSLQRFKDADVEQIAADAGLRRMYGAARPVTGSGRQSSSVRR